MSVVGVEIKGNMCAVGILMINTPVFWVSYRIILLSIGECLKLHSKIPLLLPRGICLYY